MARLCFADGWRNPSLVPSPFADERVILPRMIDTATPVRGFLEAPPQSFAALMELYELNYIYMRRLVPGLGGKEPSGGRVSVSRHGVKLCLEVLGSGHYTSTAMLTHRFQGVDGEFDTVPDLTVRIYHDARVAEVIELGGGGARRVAGSLAERWTENRFLNRWLRFSLGEGHSFAEGVLQPQWG